MKPLLTIAMNDIFNSGAIIKECNHTFLHLIPKNNKATKIQDFRPIACYNTLYKVLAKILCRRLSLCLNQLVLDNQTTFIKDRSIGDDILLAHETIRGIVRKDNTNMCVKVDLRKAYDSVNRSFVIHMLRCMNFPTKWLKLLDSLISSPVFSVIAEGEALGYFGSKNGLRQGDPLSPLLFTLVMEFFMLLMEEKVRKKMINPIKEHDNLTTHIIYVDDIIIFSKADELSAEAISDVFKKMKKWTGLELSCEKSSLYLGRGVVNSTNIVTILNIDMKELPVRYLGIPLTSVNLKDRDCIHLIDRIKKRIEGWETKFLSLAGRIELIKSMIYPIVQFWMQCFRLPETTLNKIMHICLNFLWKSKTNKVPWDMISRKKSEGGLRLRKLNELNNHCS